MITGWAGFAGQRSYWTCLCDCGQEVVSLARGVRSCGCLQRETRARNQLSMARKTALLIEQVTGKKYRNLAHAAKAFHVKHSTLRSRMCRYRDNPRMWGLKQNWPPNHKKRKRRPT